MSQKTIITFSKKKAARSEFKWVHLDNLYIRAIVVLCRLDYKVADFFVQFSHRHHL